LALNAHCFKCICHIDRLYRARHDSGMKTARLLIMLTSAAAHSSCASVATRLPDISLPELNAERESQETRAFAEMERLHERLWNVAGDESLDKSPVTLQVKRGEDRFSVDITPREICDYGVKLSMGSTVNAYATGRSITMTSGMMNFTQSDDELALIVSHELAHNTMAHVRKIVSNMIFSGFATRYTRPFESEADYVGLYYLVRAGFDPDGTEALWQRMALIGPRSVGRAKTHPTYPDRYLRLSAARKEIAAKQAAGEPLVPNYKESKE